MAVTRPKKETRSAQGRKESRTSERILDIAERLVQTRGFNNFSYADIASELGITTASLHYHFPGKAELGQALITRYASGSRRRSPDRTGSAHRAREAPRIRQTLCRRAPR